MSAHHRKKSPATVTDGDRDQEPVITISRALQGLPLFDDLFLRMQTTNLELVDAFLIEQEADLLDEYMRTERTPVQAALFVSALSQMWVFGLYELLRTWRQRARDVLGWAKEFEEAPTATQATRLAGKRQEIEDRSAGPDGADIFYWPAYEAAATTPGFAETLRRAADRTERLFRRIEALRMSLAKHEVPGIKGSFAMAPGYGRIDMSNGSIYWQIVLRGDEIDIISRREIADGCRSLADGDTAAILPESIQEMVKQFPDFSYGVKRIAVVLEDGARHRGVYVAWAREVLAIDGHNGVPFDAARVVDVRSDPAPMAEGGDITER